MIFSSTILPSALLSTLTFLKVVDARSAPSRLYEQERDACATGVHIITARGSTEAPGEGSMGTYLSSKIKALIPGSDSVGVDYPATLEDYVNSESAGARAMLKVVNEYATSCPQSKIVLMGYSQGAQIVGDVLNGVVGWSNIPATSAATIAAVIQLGDPTHKVGVHGNVGTSVRDGMFPRADTSKLATYNVQSFCDTGDVYCDLGSNNATHLEYIQVYGSDIVSYVVQQSAAFVIPSRTTVTPLLAVSLTA